MEQLKSMQHSLINCVQGQMGRLGEVDAKELGEAIDMIKDLSEAMYYCTITEAMEGKEKTHNRDIDRNSGRMYYDEWVSPKREKEPYRVDWEKEMRIPMRDHREGRSPMNRRMYMESKEMKMDKATSMKELEKYVQELTHDVVEMIEDASPEERAYLEKRISALATKVGQTANA